MLTLRNRTNSPLKIDVGPTFGEVRVPAMGILPLDGRMEDLVLSRRIEAMLRVQSLTITEGEGGDPNEGNSGIVPVPKPEEPKPAEAETQPVGNEVPAPGPIAPWAKGKKK